MKAKIFVVLVASLMVLTFSFHMSSVYAGAPSTILEGHVTDLITTLPISGANVEIRDAGGFSMVNLTTDANGFYSQDNLPATNLNVTASKSGYWNVSLYPVAVAGLTTTVQDFQLAPLDVWVRGQVKDALSQQPIVGAIVFFDFSIVQPVYDFATATNETGWYDVGIPPEIGAFNLKVSASGYVDNLTTGVIAPIGMVTTVNFDLLPIKLPVPEVPFGTLAASIAMAMALVAFAAMPRLRKRI